MLNLQFDLALNKNQNTSTLYILCRLKLIDYLILGRESSFFWYGLLVFKWFLFESFSLPFGAYVLFHSSSPWAFHIIYLSCQTILISLMFVDSVRNLFNFVHIFRYRTASLVWTRVCQRTGNDQGQKSTFDAKVCQWRR